MQEQSRLMRGEAGMQGDGRDQRGKVFTDPTIQSRIVSGLSFLPLLTLLGATLAVALLGSRVLNEARSLDTEITSLFPLFLALVLLVLSAGCMVVLQAMRYSHRIVGPSSRLLQTLDRIKEGKLDLRVQIRAGDELHDITEGINNLIDWLERHPPQGLEASESGSEDPFVLEDREEISSAFASTSD